MAKRDRTTGLPRPRRRDREHARAQRFYERDWVWRALLIGLPAVFIVAIIGLLGWRWYDDNYRRPDKVILTVADQDVTLGYLSDRLQGFAQQNPGSVATITQALFRKIEDEELTILMAQQRGIEITDEDITNHIAEQLGVEPNTERGSDYDRAYRTLLDTAGLGTDDYRHIARAEVAQQRLIDQISADVPTTGETVSYRVLTTADPSLAQEALDRLRAGEDFTAVADDISPIAPDNGAATGETPTATEEEDGEGTPDVSATVTDSEDATTTPTSEAESDGEDGEEADDPRLVESQLLEQVPDSVRDEIAAAQPGDILDPIRIGQAYAVIQLVDRNADAELTEEQIDYLAGQRFEEQLDEFRGTVDIKRNFGTSDIEWARENA